MQNLIGGCITMAGGNKNYNYNVKEDGVNELVYESNNTCIMLREVAWGNRPHKLEVRKWNVDINSTETPAKGLTFPCKEAADALVHTMTKTGFGETNQIIHNIKDRTDFDDALVKNLGMQKIIEARNTEVEVTEDDLLDPQAIMASEDK
jgi:hypothetical protein